MLNEYQVIYITRGKGIFESDNCKRKEIKAGTIILLFPGERHRYMPDLKAGWDKYWIGMKGDILDNLVKKGFFTLDNPCLHIGFNESIFNLFTRIIEKTKHETSGYQPLISGAALHIMGSCYAIIKQNSFESEEKEEIVNRTRLLFRANIANDFSPEQVAEELHIGYSSFRAIFKNYTGLSPGKYLSSLRSSEQKTC